jgi:DNA-binding LytR/AlgR family response regulator
VEITAPIIFTTAYDEYALEAFKVNSIDYLLKPVEAERLGKSLNKLQNLKTGNLNNLLQSIDQYLHKSKALSQYKTRFLIKQKDRLMTVEDHQVAYFMAKNKLVALVTFENRHFVMDEKLEAYESQVNPEHFFRLNRSILVSRPAIRNIFTHFHGKLKIELHPEMKEEVFVSRERTSAFKDWLEG